MKHISLIMLLGFAMIFAACGSKVSPKDIQGVWEIHDYILEKPNEAEQDVLDEAKALLKDNNNNLLYFSETHTGAILATGDTLTSLQYSVNGDTLHVEGGSTSNYKLKDKNTLYIFDPNIGLIIEFLRKK